jgi:hypothetical protein
LTGQIELVVVAIGRRWPETWAIEWVAFRLCSGVTTKTCGKRHAKECYRSDEVEVELRGGSGGAFLPVAGLLPLLADTPRLGGSAGTPHRDFFVYLSTDLSAVIRMHEILCVS